MSKTTSIEWCDSTVNPVMGCSGCELWTKGRKTCYAGQLHERRTGQKGFSPDFLMPKLFPGRTAEAAAWSDLAGTDRPEKPWLNGMPRLIFVSDMGDALSEKGAIDEDDVPVPEGAVPFEFLKTEIIDVTLSPNGQRHRWLWLTKRPQRLKDFCDWLHHHYGLGLPRNVWIGTSITTDSTVIRVAYLAGIGDDETVRFVSAEPLWERVGLAGLNERLSWVVVGGESRQGSPARPFHCEWARRLRDQCAGAGVAFFLKQLGSRPLDGEKPLRLKDGHGGDWSEWPADLRVREMPRTPAPECGVLPTPAAPPAEVRPPDRKNKSFVLMSEVEPEPVEYLWSGRIPLGELTILDGDPATNKTSLLLDLASRVSKGLSMPDGTPGVNGGVLLLMTEDSITKTLPLRLRAAGADMGRIAVVTEPVTFPANVALVEEVACRVRAKLIVIDPIMAYLGRDSKSDQAVRQALSPLKALAERHNIAVVLVRHLNKGGGRVSLYRGSGSIAIVASTRSALLVANDPEDDNMRVIAHVKNNLGPLAPSLRFEPVQAENGVVRIEWRGGAEYTADELLSRPTGRGDKLDKAKGFLLNLLQGGPVEQAVVERRAAEAGVAYRTVERAKEALGLHSRRRGFGPGNVVLWEMPGDDTNPG